MWMDGPWVQTWGGLEAVSGNPHGYGSGLPLEKERRGQRHADPRALWTGQAEEWEVGQGLWSWTGRLLEGGRGKGARRGMELRGSEDRPDGCMGSSPMQPRALGLGFPREEGAWGKTGLFMAASAPSSVHRCPGGLSEMGWVGSVRGRAGLGSSEAGPADSAREEAVTLCEPVEGFPWHPVSPHVLSWLPLRDRFPRSAWSFFRAPLQWWGRTQWTSFPLQRCHRVAI